MPNANKAFGRFLAYCMEKTGLSIVSANGGEKENAIAKQCDAVLVVPEENIAAFEDAVSAFETILKKEYHFTESRFAHLCREKEYGEYEALDKETAQKLDGAADPSAKRCAGNGFRSSRTVYRLH